MGEHHRAKRPTGEEEPQVGPRWTARAVLGAAALLLGALIAAAAIQASGQVAPKPGGEARVGKSAPDFTLALFNGKSVTLSGLKGKPILVNFWHSS